jgi:hypothetical protein
LLSIQKLAAKTVSLPIQTLVAKTVSLPIQTFEAKTELEISSENCIAANLEIGSQKNFVAAI